MFCLSLLAMLLQTQTDVPLAVRVLFGAWHKQSAPTVELSMEGSDVNRKMFDSRSNQLGKRVVENVGKTWFGSS